MGWKVVIKDVPPLDGEYDIDFNFKNKHLRTIKRMSGVRALEIQDALSAGDTDLMVAIVAVALEQAGRAFHEDQLWNAEPGQMELVEEAGQDADPPDETQTKSLEKNGSSGEHSNGTGDASQVIVTPQVSGHPV